MRADPLASYRDLFVGADQPLIYFDGNSLGRPLKATVEHLARFVEHEWGGRLIRGWDELWMEQPLRLGDELGRVALGAAPGQTTIGDSTTVLLYKLMRAGVASRPGRTELVVDRDNFPTDRYVAEGVARECGLTLRWIDSDPETGVTVEQVRQVVGEQTALVVLSQVAYRSAWIAEADEITRLVQDAGGLVLWDLCHSAGAVPVELDAWGADLAVGCTYKYLNGGPGSPAFCYVAERHLETITQPIQGWMGNSEVFLMGPDYVPHPSIRRMLSGTPPILAMVALQDMLALLDDVGIDAIRAKSMALTELTIDLAEQHLTSYAVQVASPRDPARRGGHVNLTHPRMADVTALLWERDVIPDYRDPGGLRIGLSPLSTSYDEVERGIQAIAVALKELL